MSTDIQYAESADKLPTTEVKIQKPVFDPNQFFTQRDKQRTYLFRFAIGMSIASLLLLFLILGFQTYFRITIDSHFEIISDEGMRIISVAIFGQVFGIVYVIAHALWSNHEFHLMGNNKK